MPRRWLLIVVLAALVLSLASLLTGCGGGTSDVAADDRPSPAAEEVGGFFDGAPEDRGSDDTIRITPTPRAVDEPPAAPAPDSDPLANLERPSESWNRLSDLERRDTVQEYLFVAENSDFVLLEPEAVVAFIERRPLPQGITVRQMVARAAGALDRRARAPVAPSSLTPEQVLEATALAEDIAVGLQQISSAGAATALCTDLPCIESGIAALASVARQSKARVTGRIASSPVACLRETGRLYVGVLDSLIEAEIVTRSRGARAALPIITDVVPMLDRLTTTSIACAAEVEAGGA